MRIFVFSPQLLQVLSAVPPRFLQGIWRTTLFSAPQSPDSRRTFAPASLDTFGKNRRKKTRPEEIFFCNFRSILYFRSRFSRGRRRVAGGEKNFKQFSPESPPSVAPQSLQKKREKKCLFFTETRFRSTSLQSPWRGKSEKRKI